MRFKLTLKIDRIYGDCLPFNYQYEQSSIIYRILSCSDEKYSLWLHNNGYSVNGSKRHKLFAYSPFIFDCVRPLPQKVCLKIIGNYAIWYISFIPEKSTSEFISGIFANQSFVIGNKIFKVKFDIVYVERIIDPPMSGKMTFQTMSPVCVKYHDGKNIKYLSPESPLFAKGILDGLLSKYESLNSCFLDICKDAYKFKLIGDVFKSKLITIKEGTPNETKVRGFLFNFEMEAPVEFMKIAYEGGIGEQCSQGFGFIRIKY